MTLNHKKENQFFDRLRSLDTKRLGLRKLCQE